MLVTKDEQTLLTSKEAAARARLSQRHIGLLIRQGSVQGHRMGDRWLVAADSLQRYLETRTIGRPRLHKAS